jgi:peptidoglycan/LPS O-acetylase OafA/YrhL
VLGSFRLLLSFCVVASHTAGYDFQRYPDAGFVAVVVFFFVSGYLMPASFQAHYGRVDFLKRSRRYLTNRFLRIYPPYWAALIFALFVVAIKDRWHEYDIDALSLVQNFLLIGLNQEQLWRNDTRLIGPAWTLDIELQYYLLVPVLMFLFERAPRALVLVGSFAAVVGILLQISPLGVNDVDRSILPWAPVFLLGLVLYRFRDKAEFASKSGVVVAIATVAVLAFIPLRARQQEWALVALGILIAAKLLTDKGIVSGVWDRLAGDLAYPVFIFHLPILILFGVSNFGFATTLAFNVFAALLVALIVHWGVVMRFEKIRDRNKVLGSS